MSAEEGSDGLNKHSYFLVHKKLDNDAEEQTFPQWSLIEMNFPENVMTIKVTTNSLNSESYSEKTDKEKLDILDIHGDHDGLLFINDSDYKKLKKLSNDGREKFFLENEKLSVQESGPGIQGSQLKLPIWEKDGDSICRGSMWMYDEKMYFVKCYQRNQNLEMIELAANADCNSECMPSPKQLEPEKLLKEGKVLVTHFYIVATENEPNFKIGELISVSNDFCVCIDSLKQRRLTAAPLHGWIDITKEESTFLFRVKKQYRVRTHTFGQLALLKKTEGDECFVECNENFEKGRIEKQHQGFIRVKGEDYTLDKVFCREPPDWYRNKILEETPVRLRHRNEVFLRITSFQNPEEIGAKEIIALVPLPSTKNGAEESFERINSTRRWSFMHLYEFELMSKEERQKEIFFTDQEAKVQNVYVHKTTGEMKFTTECDSADWISIESKYVALLCRVGSNEDRIKVVKAQMLQHLSINEQAYLLRRDNELPTNRDDVLEGKIEHFEDGFIKLKCQQDGNEESFRDPVTVDRIILKNYPSHNFSDEEGRLVYVKKDDDRIVCAKILFSATQPVSKRTEPPICDEEKWVVVFNFLTNSNDINNLDKYLYLHLLQDYPSVDPKFVVALKPIEFTEATTFYLEAFKKRGNDDNAFDGSMKVWMKIEKDYHCLDCYEINRGGNVIRNHYIKIEDHSMVGLILNLSFEERRLFFHSAQLLESELKPGGELKQLICKEKKVMVEVSGELHGGTVKEIKMQTVVVVLKDAPGKEIEVCLHKIFRSDHKIYNNYSWYATTTEIYKERPKLTAVKVSGKILLGITKWTSSPKWKDQKIFGIECLHPIDPDIGRKEEVEETGVCYHFLKVMKGNEERCMFVKDEHILAGNKENSTLSKTYFLQKDHGKFKCGAIVFEFNDACYYYEHGNELQKVDIEDVGDDKREIPDVHRRILVMALRVENLQERLRMLTSEQLAGLECEPGETVFVRRGNSGQPIADLVKMRITKYSNGEVFLNDKPVSPGDIYTTEYFDSCPDWLKSVEKDQLSKEVEIEEKNFQSKEKLEVPVPWEKEPIIVLHLDRNKNDAEVGDLMRDRNSDDRYINYVRVMVGCHKDDVIQLPKSKVQSFEYNLDSVVSSEHSRNYDGHTSLVSMEPVSDQSCVTFGSNLESLPEPVVTRESVRDTTFTLENAKGIQRLNSSCCLDNLLIALFGCCNHVLDQIPPDRDEHDVTKKTLSIIKDFRDKPLVECEKVHELREILFSKNETLKMGSVDEPIMYLNALFSGLGVTPFIELNGDKTKYYIDIHPDDLKKLKPRSEYFDTKELLERRALLDDTLFSKKPQMLILYCKRDVEDTPVMIRPSLTLDLENCVKKNKHKQCGHCEQEKAAGFCAVQTDDTKKCYWCHSCFESVSSIEGLNTHHASLQLRGKEDYFGDVEYRLFAIVCREKDSKYSSVVLFHNQDWIHHDNTTEQGISVEKLNAMLKSAPPREPGANTLHEKLFTTACMYIYSAQET